MRASSACVVVLLLSGALFESQPAAPLQADAAKPASVAGRLKGMEDALSDLEKGLLTQKDFCLADPVWYRDYILLLKTEYGIDFKAVARSQEDPKGLRAELDGYNAVMRAEIELRFGNGILDKLYEQAKANYLTDVAAEGAPTKRIKPTAEHLFFKCKLLINPSTKEKVADAVIETNGGTILRVGKAAEISIPSGAKVVDFSDKYIIPGLIDTHGHLYARTRSVKGAWRKTDAQLPIFHLAAGVTAVGNPGSMDSDGDFALRNRIDAGELPGPRYFLAGEYIDMAPLVVGWMKPVRRCA